MSPRTTITLSVHDTLYDIVERVLTAPENAVVYLEVADNRVLTNASAVSVLQSQLGSRSLVLLTDDLTVRRIAEARSIRIARRPDTIAADPTRLKRDVMRHNFTPWEYFLYEMRGYFRSAKDILGHIFRPKSLKYGSARAPFILLTCGVGLSMALLGFIFYFAVSHTTITITSEPIIRPVVANFVFSSDMTESLAARAKIPLTKVKVDVSQEQTFRIATLDSASTRNAYGKVEMINELDTEQTLRPQTRLVTEDGIVFRTTEWARVPRARSESGSLVLGRYTVGVIADVEDEKGALIGSRGNIFKDIVLTIPGLKFNRDKLYARSTEAFTGGFDPKVTVLTQGELDRTIAVYRDVIMKEGRDKLLSTIAQRGDTPAMWELLSVPGIDSVTYDGPYIELLGGAKVGDKISEIRLSARTTAAGWIYERSRLVWPLTSQLNASLLPWSEIFDRLRDDSLRLSAVVTRTKVENDIMDIKATAEMDAIIYRDFSSQGSPLIRRLTALIVGRPLDEAIEIIQKNADVTEVRIDSSPFWMTSVASNPASVEFVTKR